MSVGLPGSTSLYLKLYDIDLNARKINLNMDNINRNASQHKLNVKPVTVSLW